MPKIRNISTDTVFVQHLGVEVAPDGVIDVPAEHVLGPDDDPGDNPDARVWPGTVWHVVGDTSTPAHPAPTSDQPAE